MKYSTNILLSIISILSANIYAQKIDIYNYKNIEVKESISKVVENNGEFYNASDILFFRNLVIVSDKSNEPTFQVFKKVKADEFVLQKEIGNKGRGPGEFADVWDIFTNSIESQIYAFDAINRRIAVFDEDLRLKENEYINISSSGFYTSFFHLDNLFYATGIAIGCLVEVIDINGQTINCLGTQPSLELKSDFNERTGSQRWHSYSVRNKENGNIALFYRHANRVTLIDKDGNILKELVNDYYGIPSTQVINGNALPTNADMRAYISATSDEENIYALYSGKISDGPTSSLGTYIHVFDWSLNLKEVYKLDHLSINLIMDIEENNLYSIEYEPNNSIRLISLTNK